MRTSTNQIIDGVLVNGFDYTNQAWVRNGRYLSCGHPKTGTVIPARTDFYMQNGQRVAMHVPESVFNGCNCYGRIHAGEICNVRGY